MAITNIYKTLWKTVGGMEAFLDVLGSSMGQGLDYRVRDHVSSVVDCFRRGDYRGGRTLIRKASRSAIGGGGHVLRAVKLYLQGKYSDVVVCCREQQDQESPETSALQLPICTLFLLSEAYAKIGMHDRALISAKLCCDLAMTANAKADAVDEANQKQMKRLVRGKTTMRDVGRRVESRSQDTAAAELSASLTKDTSADELGISIHVLACLATLCLALRMLERGTDAKGIYLKHRCLVQRYAVSSKLVDTMTTLYKRKRGTGQSSADQTKGPLDRQLFDAEATLRDVQSLLEIESKLHSNMVATKFSTPTRGSWTPYTRPPRAKPERMLVSGFTREQATMSMNDVGCARAGGGKPPSLGPLSKSALGIKVSRRGMESDMLQAVEELQQAKLERNNTVGFDRKQMKTLLLTRLQAVMRGALMRTRQRALFSQGKRLRSLREQLAVLEMKEQRQQDIMKACAVQLERRGVVFSIDGPFE